nr:MAG TPA: hypothetical protein [Caudoviricetes sp.]
MRQISCPTFDDFAQCVLDSYSRLYNGDTRYDTICVAAPYEIIAYVLKSLVSTGCFIPYLLDLDYEVICETANEFVLTVDKEGLLSVEPAFHMHLVGDELDFRYIEVGADSLVYIHENVNSRFVTRNSENTFIDFDVDEQKDIEDFMTLVNMY